jgi:hypothetical protein
MRKSRGFIAIGLVAAFGMSSVAWSASLSPGAQTFQQEIKRFRASIDLGLATPDQASRELEQALSTSGITLNDLHAVAKSSLSAQEYAQFETGLARTTRGIDPSTLSPQETLDLLQEVFANSTSQGLSWSPCQATHSAIGMTFLAATVFLIVKAVKDQHTSDRAGNQLNEQMDEIKAEYAARLSAATDGATYRQLETERDAALKATMDQLEGIRTPAGNRAAFEELGAVGTGITGIILLVTAKNCDRP